MAVTRMARPAPSRPGPVETAGGAGAGPQTRNGAATMTAWLLPVVPSCLLGLFLYGWLLRHAGPWTFAAPKRRVIRGQVEPPRVREHARGRAGPLNDRSSCACRRSGLHIRAHVEDQGYIKADKVDHGDECSLRGMTVVNQPHSDEEEHEHDTGSENWGEESYSHVARLHPTAALWVY